MKTSDLRKMLILELNSLQANQTDEKRGHAVARLARETTSSRRLDLQFAKHEILFGTKVKSVKL